MKILTSAAGMRLAILLNLLALGSAFLAAGCFMPGASYCGPWIPLTDGEARLRDDLKRDLERLCGEIGPHNTARYEALFAAESFLTESLTAAGYEVRTQEYTTDNRACRNIEVEIPGTRSPAEIVVIGAHYDSAFESPGANDNGTGSVATLALARAFQGKAPGRTLRFVLFVNEEPPFFKTPDMGSVVYARRCREHGENITAMLSLETIGYYSDAKGSQKYPPPFSLFYPDTGNFIAFVGNHASWELTGRTVRTFRGNCRFPSEGVATFPQLPGVHWSDHWAFWEQGYDAVMVTDTAPFRYPWYHTAGDTCDKVDFDRLARVVTGLQAVVEDLAGVEVRPDQ